MVEKAPAADFQQLLEEFHQVASSIQTARQTAWKAQERAYSKWKELEALRNRTLEHILTERGLAVCSRAGLHGGEESEEEGLGIFPRSQMKLVYKSAVVWRGGHGYEHLDRRRSLELLCPKHVFPQFLNTKKLSEHLDSPEEDDGCFDGDIHIENKSGGQEIISKEKGFDICSEVVEIGGKYVTVVDEIDITVIPIQQGYHSEKLYQHFGLPQLPPKLHL